MLGFKISFTKVEPEADQLQPLLDLLPTTNLKKDNARLLTLL